jgi:hypothetical protein
MELKSFKVPFTIFLLLVACIANAEIEAMAGRVTLNDTRNIPAEFTHVCFDTPFSVPPLVFSLPNNNDPNSRLTLRIRNVTETGFDIAQVESPEDANPNAPAGNVPQTVDFLAIVAGDYTLSNGSLMRVASIDITDYQARGIPGRSWHNVSTLDLGYTQPPIVIASIQTMNNELNPFPSSDPFLATTIRRVNDTRFDIALERGETNTGIINNTETIAYITLPPDLTGQLTDDISYESFTTAQNITGVNTCRVVNLTVDNGENPLVFASQNSRNGNNGGWLSRCAISPTTVGFWVVEDMDRDIEGAHIDEEASGLALRGDFDDLTNSCAINHYEIKHDGHGLTCEAETISISACYNNDAGPCRLSSKPVTLNVKATGTNSITDNITFTGTGIASIPYTLVDPTVTLSIDNETITATNPTECINGDVSGDPASCNMSFADAGFRFLYGNTDSTTLPNQISGSHFNDTLKIQAVEDVNGKCEGIFTGDVNIELSQQNVTPDLTNPGLNFQVDAPTTTDIAKYDPSNPLIPGTGVALNFGANSIATITNPVYNDAGEIRLHANYNVGGITLVGSSNPFWVSPAKLVVSATVETTLGTKTLDGASAADNKTHKAGADFDLTVTAYNAATPSLITQNYLPGQIQLKLTRTGPTLAGSVDGKLTYASSSSFSTSIDTPSPVLFQNANLSNFILGVSSYSAARYSEVGLLKIDVQDRSYGSPNVTIPADVINIGRFIPDHFEQVVVEHGSLGATCDAAYSGQRDEITDNGAITYNTSPILKITAHNQQDEITQNYYEDSQDSVNDYMKLSANDITIMAPTFDQTRIGVNGSNLLLTANINSGTLSQNDLTSGSTSGSALTRGELHYKLSSGDHFYYQRSANALVPPFTSEIDFAVTSIIDTDNVDVNVTETEPASPTGVEIRFGRLVLENSLGPETSNLPQPMQLEHYNGTKFIVSSDNDCLSYNQDKIILDRIDFDEALTPAFGGMGLFESGKTQEIKLQAPGVRGEIGVSYDTYDWLKYDWSDNGAYDENPSAIATFGLFRGNDRVIYSRETTDQ